MMKRILNKLPRSERGVVLIIVLILLAVGGLTIAPMLSHMSTGLKAGQTYERKTNEYYAADAGVEDALWQIKNSDAEVPLDDLNINGKTVAVTITNAGENPDGYDTYLIESEATGDDGGSTAINSFVEFSGGFDFLLDNAITTPGTLNLPGDVSIADGDTVMCENYEDYEEEYGAEQYVGNWPTADEISAFYLTADVQNAEYIGPDGINIGSLPAPASIGPLYRDGDLDIYSTVTDATLTLDDTIYVTGDLTLGGAKDFTLDLNGQTIFVKSPTDDPKYAIDVEGKCTITGSGCIIAIGDIKFAPKMEASSADYFVLIMSVGDTLPSGDTIGGTVYLQPSGTFYGAIAAKTLITVQSGTEQLIDNTWNDPGVDIDINFPGLDDDDYTGYDLEVRTWDIS